MARMFTLFAAMLLCCVGNFATAQAKALAEDLAAEDDRGFIVGLLEDALGGEGRIVRVEGFAGALSSTATIEQLTFADTEGVWLTFDELRLKWNRSALLRGAIEIDQLSATAITLARTPNSPDDEMPAPEASGFALPDLPVSVAIDELKVDRIVLGRPILGEAAEMTLEAEAMLADGSGDVMLTATRIDGKSGRFIVDASYDADTNMAAINVNLEEDEGGIAARMLNLPSRPDLKLQISGQGNLDDLVTDLTLQTEGVERLDGQVALKGTTDAGRAFDLSLEGDLTPLLQPEYHPFFGTSSRLSARGTQAATGALELTELDLKTRALTLNGSAELDSDRAPRRLALSGTIAPETGESVTLPIGNGDTRIARAGLLIGYDASVSDLVVLNLTIDELDTPAVAIHAVEMTVDGTLDAALGLENEIRAQVGFEAVGAEFEDTAYQAAIGDQITGTMAVEYTATNDLVLNDIKFEGTDYALTGDTRTKGVNEAFETDLDLRLTANRLAQFSALAGQDLSGQAELAINGQVDIGGVFNLTLSGTTTDLGVGIEQADKVFAGVTNLELVALRNETGTQIPQISIQNAQVEANGSALLKTDASQAEFNVTLANSAQIDARLKGPVKLVGQATQDALGWRIDTTVNGPFGATSTVKGRATGTNPALTFDVQLPDVQPIAPQFRGPARLSGTATRSGDAWRVNTDLAGPYGINGALYGSVNGAAPELIYQLRIPNVAALGAQIDGALSLDGTAAQRGSTWQIDTALSGLSGTRVQVSGQVLSGGTLKLTASGTAPLALANPFIAPRNLQGRATFDLALRGRAALSSLSGTIRTSDASLSAPNLRFSLTGISAQVSLANNRAQIAASASVASGGRLTVNGSVVLTRGMTADLAVALSGVRVVDPKLYETSLDGRVTMRGPLGGGALIAGVLNVGETNIRVPESQVAGFTIVPKIVHRNAPSGVRQTLQRAGLDQSGSASTNGSGTSYGLDIRVNAPSRIFVRGRGLDAELGGSLSLSGTTNQIISTGRFDLIRGRLDILTKRFVLNEGRITLQGDFDPYLRFVATTRTDTGTASIIIEGLASDPKVSFSSVPDAPEDEVLAQIFFGRNITQLSAFQALQLASAVATLAGTGGEGIVSKLRRGFGLDDLDITTDDQGNTGLRLGKYITDNVYTDVTVGNDNTAGVSINIDLTPSITARGQVKSNGNSSIGIYFEKDY